MKQRLIALIILDGWGYREETGGNAVALANTPFFDGLWEGFPHTVIHASEERVGLPSGQMGNSEVGHLNLGAGRVVYQDIVRISKSIRDGDFFRNPVFCKTMDAARENGKALHLVGLLSDGGVHTLHTHLYALLEMAKQRGLARVFVHPLFDGRDTPPNSGIHHLRSLLAKMDEIGVGEVATVGGRYYGMDRDNRWDRTERAFRAMVRGAGKESADPVAAVSGSYGEGKNDEFIEPTVIIRDGQPVGSISEGDSVIFFNFRADRARQLTRALTQKDFDRFPRPEHLGLEFACLTPYDETFHLPVAFPAQAKDHLLADVFASRGIRNLRLAETEKYAHVTYFFNGGREQPFAGEERIIVPSPRVATYDMQPEMSAAQVANELINAIEHDSYDFIVTNFANTDMVGHTARREAVIRAVETIDNESHRVFRVALERGWRILLTADHGNCDEMINPNTGEPHTQHSEYPVPLLIMGAGPVRLGTGRGLADIAPTILDLLGLPRPPEMTGRSLILKDGLL